MLSYSLIITLIGLCSCIGNVQDIVKKPQPPKFQGFPINPPTNEKNGFVNQIKMEDLEKGNKYKKHYKKPHRKPSSSTSSSSSESVYRRYRRGKPAHRFSGKPREIYTTYSSASESESTSSSSSTHKRPVHHRRRSHVHHQQRKYSSKVEVTVTENCYVTPEPTTVTTIVFHPPKPSISYHVPEEPQRLPHFKPKYSTSEKYSSSTSNYIVSKPTKVTTVKPSVMPTLSLSLPDSQLSSSSECYEPHQQLVELKVDNGFYPFSYGETGSKVFQKFEFDTSQWTLLRVTDCFCKGDVFEILDRNNYIGLTSEGCSEYVTEDCPHPVTDPWKCIKKDSGFCKGHAYLRPGRHNITLSVLFSPREAGNAFLRVDTVCQNAGELVPCCELNGNCK